MVAMGKTGTHKSLRLLILGFLFFIGKILNCDQQFFLYELHVMETVHFYR